MPDYKKMYISLFNAVTDAVEILKEAQQEGEEAYVSSGEILRSIADRSALQTDQPNNCCQRKEAAE